MKKTFIGLAVAIILIIVGTVLYFNNSKQVLPPNSEKSTGPNDLKSLILQSFKNNEIILQVDKGSVILTSQSPITLSAPEKRVVSVGAEIKTASDSAASIFYPNGTVATMDSDTSIIIAKFEDLGKSQNSKIKLVNGNLWSRVEQVLDKENTYEVQTNNAVATVRGTSILNQYKNGKSKLTVVASTKKVQFKALDPATGTSIAGGSLEVDVDKSVEADEKFPPSAAKPLQSQSISPEDKKLQFFLQNFDKDKQINAVIVAPETILEIKQAKPGVQISTKLEVILEQKQEELNNNKNQATTTPEITPKPTKSPSPSPTASTTPTLTPSATPSPEPALIITSISPNEISPDRTEYGFSAQKIKIYGSGFSGDISGSVGSISFEDITIINSTTIEATISGDLNSGTYDITLRRGNKQSTLSKSLKVN